MKGLKTCKGCNGQCCKYVVVEIDTPKTLEDFEDIKWYVCHKNVNVYVEEDGSWNVEFITDCQFLDKNHLCTIYERRPKICREYSQNECHFYNPGDEPFIFRVIEDVEIYIKEIFNKGLHTIK